MFDQDDDICHCKNYFQEYCDKDDTVSNIYGNNMYFFKAQDYRF